MIVADQLYAAYPLLPSGGLSVRHACIVSGKHLAVLARQVGLEQCVRRGGAQRGSAISDNVMADIFEAVAAAVHRDGGLAAAVQVIGSLFHHPVATITGGDDKGALITYASHTSQAAPSFTSTRTAGPSHAPIYTVSLAFAGNVYSVSTTNVKDGEKTCAVLAVQVLRAAGANI